MQKKALFVATSLAMGSPAYALDLTYYGGAALQQTTLEASLDFVPTTPSTGNSGDDTATELRLFGGAITRAGSGFYGVEAALEDGKAEETIKFSTFPSAGPGQRGQIQDGRSLSLSVIGGVDLLENARLYGRIGYIRTEFDFKTLSASSVEVDSKNKTFTDLQYAIGFDYFLSDRIAVRAELSRTDYDDKASLVGNVTGVLAEFDDISRDALSIGIFTTF